MKRRVPWYGDPDVTIQIRESTLYELSELGGTYDAMICKLIDFWKKGHKK